MFSQIPFLFFYFLFSTSELWLSHTCKREMGGREKCETISRSEICVRVHPGVLETFLPFFSFFSLRAGLQLKLYGYATLFFIFRLHLGNESGYFVRWHICLSKRRSPYFFSLCLSTHFIFFCGKVLMEKRVHLEAGVNSQTTGELGKWRSS